MFHWIRNLLAAFGLICLIYFLFFDLSEVISNSMAPTLRGDGQAGSDWILSEKISLWFRRPRRWEVVQFVSGDHMLVAKRVGGLPGEKVTCRDNRLAVNGAFAPVPASLGFLKYYSYGNVHLGKEVDCGQGYFLLGDDSRDSQDSRFEGPIPPPKIRARVLMRVWPPGRVGFVNP